MAINNFGNESRFNKGAGQSKPLSKLGDLKNYSPVLDNDKITEVDFMDNTHAPGFVKDFQGPSKYVEDSSQHDLDNGLTNHIYKVVSPVLKIVLNSTTITRVFLILFHTCLVPTLLKKSMCSKIILQLN